MKEIILLCLAVYGLHSFAQSTEQRVQVNTVPNRAATPNNVPNKMVTPSTVPNTTAPNRLSTPSAVPTPSTNMDPQRARGTTDGSMNSNVPPINKPDRTNVNTINDYPTTRAREAARQGWPTATTSSDRTQPRTN